MCLHGLQTWRPLTRYGYRPKSVGAGLACGLGCTPAAEGLGWYDCDHCLTTPLSRGFFGWGTVSFGALDSPYCKLGERWICFFRQESKSWNFFIWSGEGEEGFDPCRWTPLGAQPTDSHYCLLHPTFFDVAMLPGFGLTARRCFWKDPPQCSYCDCTLIVKHVLLECDCYNITRQGYFNAFTLKELFDMVSARDWPACYGSSPTGRAHSGCHGNA